MSEDSDGEIEHALQAPTSQRPHNGHWSDILEKVMTIIPRLYDVELALLEYVRALHSAVPAQELPVSYDKLPLRSMRPKDRTAWMDLVDKVAGRKANGHQIHFKQ